MPIPTRKTAPKFDLEYQYQLFLQRMGLTEAQMHPQQKIQLKQTFYAACGQILTLMRDDITKLSDDDGVKVLQNLDQQVANFFLKANGKLN